MNTTTQHTSKKRPEYSDPQCIGTENWYRLSPLFPNLILSDGAKICFDKLQCYWVGDVIGSYIRRIKNLNEYLLFARVNTYEDCHAVFTIEDGNDKIFIKQQIQFTDLSYSLLLYVAIEDGYIKIFLPSEY